MTDVFILRSKELCYQPNRGKWNRIRNERVKQWEQFGPTVGSGWRLSADIFDIVHNEIKACNWGSGLVIQMT